MLTLCDPTSSSTFPSFPPTFLEPTYQFCIKATLYKSLSKSHTDYFRSISHVHSSSSYERSQMGRRVAFTSLFHRKREASVSSPPASWLWPSCKHPMTHSFRKDDILVQGNEIFDVLNSSHLDSSESCFSYSSEGESKSFSSGSEAGSGAEALEAVAGGIRSDRFFFELGSTGSIMEEAAKAERLLPLRGSIAMEIDSKDPYWDFRLSMEEVVMAHGLVEVQSLEKMLCWYLKMNAKKYHGIIIEAFLDVLLNLVSSSSSSSLSP